MIKNETKKSICKHLMHLIPSFSPQEHSGTRLREVSSRPYLHSFIPRLLLIFSFLITTFAVKTNPYNKMKLVKPKKFLGQHFLKDLDIAQGIADTVDACPGLPILEVGPGMGVMTQFLVRKERPLKVVEIDFESVAYLRANFPKLEDCIIEDDFLKMHLERTFDGKPFVLTGNYPYNISSQIFFKMLDYKDLIPCCTGMIQKEVAERIAASPGSKTYGILSVLIQAWYSVEYLFTVHEHVFNPPPKVKSAVIRMTRNTTTDLGCDERLFKQIVKTTFNQRRKVLRNSIRPVLSGADNFLQQQGIPVRDHQEFLSADIFGRRPEQLSVQDFIALTNAVAAETAPNR